MINIYLKYMAGILLLIISPFASAAWVVLDRNSNPSGAAMICSSNYGLRVYAPTAPYYCNNGILFAADYDTSIITFAENIAQGKPLPESAERVRAFNAMTSAVMAGPIRHLEDYRPEIILKNKMLEYKVLFNSASSLEDIENFEAAYKNHDPDFLIAKLADKKLILMHEKYLSDYKKAKTVDEIKNFIYSYQNYDPDGLVANANKRLPQARKYDKELEVKEAQQLLVDEAKQRERAKKEAAEAVLTRKKEAVAERKIRLSYIRELEKKYRHIIFSKSAYGLKIVNSYAIDCNWKDGRILKLVNLMYASAKMASAYGADTRFYIYSPRNNEVIIYVKNFRDGQSLGSQREFAEIDGLERISFIDMTSEAAINACYGVHGDIWSMPND